jgi:cysteine-rich repeat protein
MRRLTPVFLLGGFLLTSFGAPALAAPAWRCEPRLEGDGVCDCGCGRRDALDCEGETFEMCARSGCPEGQVPWEHAPDSCMTSACGDGWLDPARGEVCDDGEALAGGGCNADCSAVNDGWVCLELADKCERLPADVDAGSADVEDAGSAAAEDVQDEGPVPDAQPGAQTDGAAATEDAAQPTTGGGAAEPGAQPDDGAGGAPTADETPERGGCGAGGSASGLLLGALAGALLRPGRGRFRRA